MNVDNNVLSSEWGALSPHLLALFYEVERSKSDVNTFVKSQKSKIVQCPFVESDLEISLNWLSPFENAGDGIAPTVRQLVQSGVLQPTAKKFDDTFGTNTQQILSQIEGATAITKLNSVQIFNGMPPIKFTVTAIFRAWKDPVTEVQKPIDQLVQWALPVELAEDGLVFSRLANSGAKEALLPSKSPCLIAMQYKGRTYAPLVIESISLPLSSPIDASGNFVELQIPMTICSLSAWDRRDWENTQTSRG